MVELTEPQYITPYLKGVKYVVSIIRGCIYYVPMNESIRLKFGKRIRKLRQAKGLTQEKLSELSGIAYKHIQRIESDNPNDIKLETIDKLAKALRITRSNLLDF